MTRPLRIVYAAGPGNVIATFRKWRDGIEDASEMVPSYSGQFFDFCKEHGHRALVVAANDAESPPEFGHGIEVRHRPIAFPHGPSFGYHLGQLWSALRVIGDCLRFRCDVLVIVSGTCHWFPLAILRAFGVRIIISVHNRLWLPFQSPGRLRRGLNRLDGRFYRRTTSAIISASAEISRQIRELCQRRDLPIHDYLPIYRAGMFDSVSPPPAEKNPFRVLFIGRIEENKGVYDLLAIAKRFAAAGRSDIEFDLCGNGTELANVQKQAELAGLGERFRTHGHCDRPTVLGFLSRCHIVIVPTTSQFNEGFNQVVVEGILAGRPVISSAMCPAIDYVRPGVEEVPIDDVHAYGDMILRLCDDHNRYAERCRGAQQCQSIFFDGQRSWGTALARAVAGEPPLSWE